MEGGAQKGRRWRIREGWKGGPEGQEGLLRGENGSWWEGLGVKMGEQTPGVREWGTDRGENAAWDRSHPAAIAAVMVQILSADGTASEGGHDRESIVVRHHIAAVFSK